MEIIEWNIHDEHKDYQHVRGSLTFRFSRFLLEGFLETSDAEAPITLKTNLKSMAFLVSTFISMYQEFDSLDELRKELEEENQ